LFVATASTKVSCLKAAVAVMMYSLREAAPVIYASKSRDSIEADENAGKLE
jgi:hypothetical protein